MFYKHVYVNKIYSVCIVKTSKTEKTEKGKEKNEGKNFTCLI